MIAYTMTTKYDPRFQTSFTISVRTEKHENKYFVLPIEVENQLVNEMWFEKVIDTVMEEITYNLKKIYKNNA